MFDITYGLIVFFIENDIIKYHIYQRRDTLAYIQFIKGQVLESRLETCLSFMTNIERKRILEYEFKDLWMDLYSINPYNFIPTLKYLKAEETFKKFDKNIVKKIRNFYTLEWSLPKGRKRHPNEFSILCSKREYSEETTNNQYLHFVDIQPIKCIDDIKKEISYFYIAKSSIKFKHKYYMLKNKIKRFSVSPETQDLKWVTLEESIKLLKPIHYNVLKEAHKIITSSNIKFTNINTLIHKYQ